MSSVNFSISHLDPTSISPNSECFQSHTCLHCRVQLACLFPSCLPVKCFLTFLDLELNCPLPYEPIPNTYPGIFTHILLCATLETSRLLCLGLCLTLSLSLSNINKISNDTYYRHREICFLNKTKTVLQ